MTPKQHPEERIEDIWPSLDANEILDNIIKLLCFNPNLSVSESDIKRKIFNGFSGQLLDDIYRIAIKDLIALGYAEEGYYQVQVTFKGKRFYQNSYFPYKNRPFKYEQFVKKMKTIWNIVKIVAGVINAVAIILVAIVGIYVQAKFNQKQLDLQRKQFEYELKQNKEEQENTNNHVQQNLNMLNSIVMENKSVNQPNFITGLSFDYIDANRRSMYFWYKNTGKRDAINTNIIIQIKVDGKQIQNIKSYNQRLEINAEDAINKVIEFAPNGKQKIEFVITIRCIDDGNRQQIVKQYYYSGYVINEIFEILKQPNASVQV